MVDTRESLTAKLCSFARAYHSNTAKQKIFDDYLAYDLMGREEYEEIGQLIEHTFDLSKFNANHNFCRKAVYPLLDRYIAPIPLSRIAFAEKELNHFAKEHQICQYVICGAGMDTFAFRNENPNLRIFELDHPDTQRYKLEKIRALEWRIPEHVRYASIDFSKNDMAAVLKEAGFDPLLPSFFAILGVTYYLTLPVWEQTIGKIGALSGNDSKIVFDFPDETTFSPNSPERVRLLTEITAKLGETMQHGYSLEEIQGVLRRQSFQIAVHETPDTIQKKYFDNRTDGQKAYENMHLILAQKRRKSNETNHFHI